AIGLTPSEQTEQQRGDHRARQRAVAHPDAQQQRGGGSGERQLRRTVHGERHPAHDDEWPQRARHQPEYGLGEQGRLHEVESEQFQRQVEVEQPVHTRAFESVSGRGERLQKWCTSSSQSALCAPATWIWPPILTTSTREQYNSDSVRDVITSSGVPMRNRPSTR